MRSLLVSSVVARASALLLCIGGLALLFAADDILPRLVAGFPPAGAWLGQLLGAAWLAVAALDWLNRSALLGGIYGRPVVLTNAALFFISATVLLRAATRAPGSTALWALTAAVALPALVYAWLLYRGPAERDLAAHREAAQRAA